MSIKHQGSFDDLQTIIKAVGYTVVFAGDHGDTKQVRTSDGAIVNWFPSTSTVQFQGSKAISEKLKTAFCEYTGIATLNGAVATSNTTATTLVPKAPDNPQSANKRVFVVHGHDSSAREQLELIIHKLGLDPFVLQNTGGGGLTIIEALEREIGPKPDAARFGIVLLTPDDFGYSKVEGESAAQPRARQNVVLEMGMLVSTIGRGNVAILKKGHLEVPSDAQGILYIPFNDHVKETVPKLVDRLRAAGFVLNPDNITKAST